MAKNRTIPFSYCMRNGEVITEPTESKAVVRIFEEYLNGSSFLQIAKLMESEKIRYIADSEHWDKNMVKRIIENEKYLGNGKYPQIIDGETFKIANKKRVQKATSVCVISEDLQEIRNRTYVVIGFQESAVTAAARNGTVEIQIVTDLNISLLIR